MTGPDTETGVTVEHFKTIDSTNAELKRRITRGMLGSVAAVSAGVQTAGRGRRGRTWLNTEGSLMLSAAFPLDGVDPDRIPLVSLAAAMAAFSAITRAGVNARIKWPNDIVVLRGGCCFKLAGILSELASAPDGGLFAVIGIGINVNSPGLPEGLMQPATSVLIEKGESTDIARLRDTLLEALVREMELLKASAPELLERYNQNCVTIGQRVTAYFMDSAALEGEALGIDERGRLLIKTEAGTVPVDAADVSVRFADKTE